MSKRFDRENRVVERLQEENKKLKSENKQLLKRLREATKGYYRYMVADGFDQEQEALKEVKEIAKKICYDCQIGEYKEIIIINRRFRECQNCGKRGKVTILK
jgi:hypothetical protein